MSGTHAGSQKGIEAVRIVGVIPARMASSRFPGKPLAKICGLPMIGHVYLRSRMSPLLDEVYVATCDNEIEDYIRSFGGKALNTKRTHERASDRCAEALAQIEVRTAKRIDIVVMIQGDEPMITPGMINQAVKPLIKDKSVNVVNLMSPIETAQEHADPNEVKVVVDRKSYALYFSREPIPSGKKTTQEIPRYRQVCIIPFRRNFLFEFNRWAPTPLERIESVDMLRVLEKGYKVKMVKIKQQTYSVDTPEDLACVEKEMRHDLLRKKYDTPRD